VNSGEPGWGEITWSLTPSDMATDGEIKEEKGQKEKKLYSK